MTEYQYIENNRKALLSTLWLFILLNIIFRDLHEFITARALNEMLSGMINGTKITEELLLIGAVMIELPILMVLLSRILPKTINRWSNIIAALLTAAVTIMNTPRDMDDAFFLTVEVFAFIAIIWLALKWPVRQKS